MVPPKRPRACDACHSIKIKCELGSTGDEPPCSRCQRLGKECIITPPKRQKDRVAELEAKVEALTKLLEAQRIQTPPTDGQEDSSPSSTSQPIEESDVAMPRNNVDFIPGPKKRRLDGDTVGTDANEISQIGGRILGVDPIISQDLQRQITRKYLEDMVPAFPLIPIVGNTSYEALRQERPLLLQAIVYAACTGIIPDETQEEIAKVVIELLVTGASAKGEKSLELVQALMISFAWWRSPRFHTQIAILHFLPMTIAIAEEIGLAGEQCFPGIGERLHLKTIDNIFAKRTWLVCHLLSSSMAILMRRPSSRVWNEQDEASLQMMAYSTTNDWDRLVGQYVRAERLCERIANELELFDNSSLHDVTDPNTQKSMRKLQNMITDWKVQIPPSLQNSITAFWEQVAVIYTHEPVLHTSTNKQSFAAPFLAEMLSITDFPAPLIVTEEHLASLYALTRACHSLLDIFCSFDLSDLISLPVLMFSGRVAYTDLILAKIYIACTAAGNTLGTFFETQTLQLDEYLDKVNAVGLKVSEVDARCGTARVLGSVRRLRELLQNYRSSCVEFPRNSSIDNKTNFENFNFTSDGNPGELLDLNAIDAGFNISMEEFFTDTSLAELFPSLSEV